MSHFLGANDILPDLPFVNRVEELAILRRFFEDRSEEGENIGVLDGEGGLGKTALIKQAQERLSGQYLVVWLTAPEQDGRHRDIFENALYGTLCAVDTTTKAGRAVVNREKLVTFTKKILPSVATDAREIANIGSNTLFNVAQYVVASAIRSLGFDGFTIGARFHDLIRILWKDGIKTIFIVEDLHKRTPQDGERLIDFLVALDKIPDGSPHWSVLVTSLPIGDYFNRGNALRPFWRVRNRWRIKSWTIRTLMPPHMERLADLYIENSDFAEPILGASNGNPSVFFEVIQKLSFRHRLIIHDKKVRLLSDVGDILALGNTFDDTLAANVTIRRVCGALAIGATNVLLRVLLRVARVWPGQIPDDFDRSLDALRASSYIVTYDDAFGDRWCRLRDDSIKEATKRALNTAVLDELDVHRGLFEGYKSLFSQSDLTTLRSVGDPSCVIAKEISSIPYIDLYTQACFHAVFGGVADWYRFAVSSVRLLDYFGRFAEVITFANTVLPRIDAVFDERSAISMSLRSLLSKAYYYIRDFDTCLTTLTARQLGVCSQSEILYYQVSSIISAKIDSNPELKTKDILRRVRDGRGVDKEWLPQIVSAHAFAQLEKGQFVSACATYAFFYFRHRFFGRHDVNWYTFAMMSPLFLPVREATGMCEAAYQFFSDTDRMRLAGMALHNLGYCSLRRADFNKAYDLFDRSDKILTVHAQEEAGFCKTNKAFIHLIQREGRQAKALSSDALKFFRSPFYVAAARVNLALADWMLGSRNAASHLDQIPEVAGLTLDPNQSWRIVFNRAFIVLHTDGIRPTQEQVNEYFSALNAIRSTGDAALFWNHMIAELRRTYSDIVWPEFRTFGVFPLSFITTKLSPFRASTLCFGHA